MPGRTRAVPLGPPDQRRLGTDQRRRAARDSHMAAGHSFPDIHPQTQGLEAPRPTGTLRCGPRLTSTASGGVEGHSHPASRRTACPPGGWGAGPPGARCRRGTACPPGGWGAGPPGARCRRGTACPSGGWRAGPRGARWGRARGRGAPRGLGPAWGRHRRGPPAAGGAGVRPQPVWPR